MTRRSGRASHLKESAPAALSGRSGVWSGAGGPQCLGFPNPAAEAARVCFTSLVVGTHPAGSTSPLPSAASVSPLSTASAPNPTLLSRVAASPSEQESRSDYFSQRVSGEAFVQLATSALTATAVSHDLLASSPRSRTASPRTAVTPPTLAAPLPLPTEVGTWTSGSEGDATLSGAPA